MTRKTHGVLGLGLLAVAIVIGVLSIARFSIFIAAAYVVLSIVFMGVIVYSFCSKCPCRNDACGHVLPGKLTRILPKRGEGRYGIADYAGVAVGFLLIVLFPQPWLWASPVIGVMFWMLLVITTIDVVINVCRGCGNRYCPVRKAIN